VNGAEILILVEQLRIYQQLSTIHYSLFTIHYSLIMKPCILMTTEGTYPFLGGGVSTWCHELTQQMPEVDFKILAIVANPYLSQQYPLSSNVKQVLKVPLWGMEDPIEYGWRFPFSRALKSKIATNGEIISQRFIPLFDRLLTGILSPERIDVEMLGRTLVAIHEYFLRYDYHKTMMSIEVWESFQKLVTTAWQSQVKPDQITIGEITDTLKLLYRLLIPLHVPIPAVDLIHASSASYCGLPGVIGKIKYGIPYLLTEHGINIREQYLNLRTGISSIFVRRFLHYLVGAVVKLNYHFADIVAPVCKYNTRWEQWWEVPPARIKIIYNGADPQKFKPQDYPQNSHPVVMNMGLIFALKGQLTLIEAAAIVRDKFPDVEFRLYGKPSDLDYFARCQEKVTEHQLENTVNFAGFTNEPWRVYGTADVVAMSSISEGFPYAVIEAMLCEAAIVSTDVGGVSEALGDTGLLVPANQPIALAESIIQLLSLTREQRMDLGKKSRQRGLALFTQEKCIQTYLDTYHQLIRRARILEIKTTINV
jgi:polysaccharide biosynthesis protein PelF